MVVNSRIFAFHLVGLLVPFLESPGNSNTAIVETSCQVGKSLRILPLPPWYSAFSCCIGIYVVQGNFCWTECSMSASTSQTHPRTLTYPDAIRLVFRDHEAVGDLINACKTISQSTMNMMSMFNRIGFQMHTIDLQGLGPPMRLKWMSLCNVVILFVEDRGVRYLITCLLFSTGIL